MPKETIAILGLALTLIAAVFGFGIRIGTLTERVENQSKQIELLAAELRAINQHLVAYIRGASRKDTMSRFSKLLGAGVGSAVGIVIAMFLPESTTPEQSEAIKYLVFTVFSMLGTYAAPANTPAP